MAKMRFNGLNQVIAMLERVGDHVQGVEREVLYYGAEKVADAMEKAVESIPVETRTQRNGAPWWGTEEYPINGLAPTEKEQALAQFGIMDFETSMGTTYTKIGFTGMIEYDDGGNGFLRDHVATGELMQATEDGTYFRTGQHVIRPAAQKARGPAQKAMQQALNDQIDKLTGGS